jgi:hypothetical protein
VLDWTVESRSSPVQFSHACTLVQSHPVMSTVV